MTNLNKGSMSDGADGPLLYAMMLGNQNNNNGANNTPPSNSNVPPSNSNTQPVDSIPILPSSVVLEYEPEREAASPGKQNFGIGFQHGDILRITGYAEPQKQVENIDITTEFRSKESTTPVLSIEQLQFWNRNGYLVIEEALNSSQLTLLKDTLMDVVERLSDEKEPARKCHDISGDSCYDTENRVVNPNGRLVATILKDPSHETLDPLQRIRRMGTGVHRVLPAFRSLTFSQKNQSIVSLLGYEDPRITQSIIITKPKKIGAEVIPHQDSCSSFTDPPSCVTFWYALQDALSENGCLKVVPGSHRTEPLTMRTRCGKNGYPEIVDLPEPIYAKDQGSDYDAIDMAGSQVQRDPNGEFVYKVLEVKAGTLILLHGNLVHASDANRSGNNRLAYNFGVVEGKLPWPEDAYLQPYEGHSKFEKLEAKLGF